MHLPSNAPRKRAAGPGRAFAVAVALAAHAAVGAPAGSPALHGRERNVVQVEGSTLDSLQGLSIGELALLAHRGGAFEAIPFQIDERDPEGEWVLTHGLEAGTDVDDGAVDANDLLLFMAADVGGRATTAPPARAGLELGVHDPITGARGWVYLVPSPGAPPRSDRRYVSLETSTDSIESEFYGLTFSRKIPISLAYLTLHLGDPPRNLVDRLKVRGQAILFGLIEWSIDEEDMRSVPTGYLPGPIRAIRRVRNQIHFGMGLESPLLYFDTVYYRDSIYLPVKLHAPFEGQLVLVESAANAYVDFRGPPGWGLKVPGAGTIQLDGETSPDERRVLDDPASSFVIVGPKASLYVRMILDESLPEVVPYLHLVDSADLADPPEEDPGQRPSIGVRFTRLETLSEGTHDIDVEIHLLVGYEIGDEVKAQQRLDRPLETTAGPFPG